MNESKIKQLFEQGGPAAFRRNWEQSLGVHADPITGRKSLNRDKRELDHNQVEHGRCLAALLGPNWRAAFEQFWVPASQMRYEGTNPAVMSGDLAYVSAALDVVAGLLNARALERPSAPEFIFDQMCTVTEIQGEGGFDTIVRPNMDVNAQAGTDLADGQPGPTVGLVGSRVHRRRTKNQHKRVAINKYTILNDVTGTLYEAIDEVANLVLFERERKVADCAMGIGSATQAPVMVQQDGLEWFPYQAGIYGTNAGAAKVAPESGKLVANYANAVNGDTLGLTDYTLLVRALAMMSANRDPFTNLPVNVLLPGMKMLVDPSALPQVEYLMQASSLWQMANGGLTTNGGTNTVSSLNLLLKYGIQPIASQVWANRLKDVGICKVSNVGVTSYAALTNAATDTYTTAGSARSFYCLGHFSRAIRYAQRQPYTVQQVPLSSQEYAEETVLVQDFRERGDAYWVDPRMVYRAYA